MTATAGNSSSASAPSPLISVQKAANYLGLSVAYLNKLRVAGGSPVFHKVGARVLYRYADLDAWLADKRRTSTADDGQEATAA